MLKFNRKERYWKIIFFISILSTESWRVQDVLGTAPWKTRGIKSLLLLHLIYSSADHPGCLPGSAQWLRGSGARNQHSSKNLFLLPCRSTASTGWLTSTTLSLCRTSCRSSMTSTTMSLPLSLRAWLKDQTRSPKRSANYWLPMAYEVFPQTLNMTNRWKKTSEDVQAISAPKVNPPTFLQMDASCQKCLLASQPELFCRISPASSPASPFPTLSQSQNTTSSRHQWKTKEM